VEAVAGVIDERSDAVAAIPVMAVAERTKRKSVLTRRLSANSFKAARSESLQEPVWAMLTYQAS
jgi:hypothetical protein